MTRLLFLIIGLFSLSLPAFSDPAIPDRRLSVERDTDFFGGDLRAIFDTTYEVCRTACLTDTACRAFTFNSRSNACFPKSSLTDRQPYAGAFSAVVTEVPPADVARADTRRGELAFLGDTDIARALNEAGALPARHTNTGLSAVDLLQGAREARAGGNTGAALTFTGMALGLTDAADLWVEYARLALNLEADDNRQRAMWRARALTGAINGYLRATTLPVQVSALSVMADALERTNRGRDMIPALRLAQTLAPRDDTAARLDDAIGKFGFRITEHEVESDSASPRICALFSEPLVQAGVDYAPFVQTEVSGLSIQPQDDKLCLEGVEHGARYRVTFREGLPAASGETLAKSVVLNLYVRDRAPVARFAGRGYVLPAGGEIALPIVTVNLSEVDLVLRRISERNVIRAIQDRMFGQPVPEYRQDAFSNEMSAEIWRGTGIVQNELNRDMTTRLPLAEVAGDLSTGIYALQAGIPDADPYENPPATQWFVVSDLGLTTLSGTDGLHAFVRSLSSADPVAGVKVTLLSRANAVLGIASTDPMGHAVFAAGLTRGTGGAAPALLLVENGADDMAFLPLTDPEFDLSDRGVEGRAPAGPMDVFLTTDRGAYRAGETIVATTLLRDNTARAITDLPLTAILLRPDGMEYARTLSPTGNAGGHIFRLPTGPEVARGTWRIDIHADPDTPALASQSLLIEDFLPERIDAELALPDGPLMLANPADLSVTARYLFGAPAADLSVEGNVRLSRVTTLDAHPGYEFGRHDEEFGAETRYLDTVTTDADGAATLPLDFPEMGLANGPLSARITVQVQEGSGRPIERRIIRAVAPAGALLGIRPGFDDVLPENTEAAFSLIAIETAAEIPVRWTINRVEREYQWYTLFGNWEWEPITRRTRIATGEATLGATPVSVSAPVGWGSYEIVVERLGAPFAASSMAFEAGWYTAASARDTPDTLEVSLDKPRYAPGDIAKLRLVPRYAGKALVTVMSDRLIDMVAVEVTAGENLIDIPVTDQWGAGAYVAATVLRPSGDTDETAPARALGLSYAPVDPGMAQLRASFDVPTEAAPRTPFEVALNVEGIAPGETAWASIAAVDLGILNLTGFQSPDPSEYYFGQRKLGVAIRDIYGRLIDGGAGTMGAVRSGGDASGAMRLQSPPPTEELLAYVSAPVQVGADGIARASFELPAFNGTVRLMAVVWSDTGVGQATTDVLVRDPIVVTATLPRFMAPGDTSRMLLEVVHASGPTGIVALRVGGAGVTLGTDALPAQIPLGAQEKQVFSVPITAGAVGDYTIEVTLTTPEGRTLARQLTLPVRLNDPETHRTSRFTLAPGATFTFDNDVFAGLRPGSGTATLTAGPLARFDSPGLLEALDRYPYGCTEQVASQALPLLYLDEVARAMGLGTRDQLRARIEQAVARVLSNQGSGGGFGLWRPDSGDFWLDSYVTDFLSRARAQGVAVPDIAFRLALDNLRNRVNYAPDFDDGGEDIAYALHVLAREGAAAIGDLRYYADVKSEAFATPLAVAQLGAALAAYGDPTRADALFAQAGRMLTQAPAEDAALWRSDYGTRLRDNAAVLTLAVEAGSTAFDRAPLIDAIAPVQGGPQRSTQEAVWSLLAANALLDDTTADSLTVNGQVPDGPLIRVLEAQTTGDPLAITNTGASESTLTLTTFGIPEVPEPAGGEGYAIQRSYFTLEGDPITPDAVPVGTRLVTLLTVQPFAYSEARLMVNDPLPAGFEIDNPNLLRGGEIAALDWLDTVQDVAHSEFRSDRFLTAIDWRSAQPFRLAYIVRAISPGTFHHPAASVEDMYRPRYRAITETGQVVVTQ